MTAADRLRAAVEAALPDGWLVLKPGFDDFREADSGLREIVLAAVLPIVEERDAEIARLRAVLAKIARKCEQYRNADGLKDAEVHAVLNFIARCAAGVALPEHKL